MFLSRLRLLFRFRPNSTRSSWKTVLVNGITAWRMLYRKARVKAGQTTLARDVASLSGGC